MSRRVGDAIVASIKADEQFTRSVMDPKCNLVPILTVLFRQETRKRRGGRLGDAVRGRFLGSRQNQFSLSEGTPRARTPLIHFKIHFRLLSYSDLSLKMEKLALCCISTFVKWPRKPSTCGTWHEAFHLMQHAEMK